MYEIRGMEGSSTLSDSSHSSLQNRVLSTLLNELDGVLSSTIDACSRVEDLVFVLAACKEVESLDEALLRPG